MKPQLLPLTSLRFFAGLAVVLQHMHLTTGSGSTAVEFFFILSGFILTYGYTNVFSTINRSNVVKFLVLRIARLYPVYLLTGLLAGCMWVGSPWPYSNKDVLASLFALQTYFPIGDKVAALNGPSWSVANEFFFYMAFPFLLFSIKRSGLSLSFIRLALFWIIVATIRICVAIPFMSDNSPYSFGWWLLYISPYIRILGFVQGMLLGEMFLLKRSTLTTSHNGSSITWTALEAMSLLLMIISDRVIAPMPTALQLGGVFAPSICIVIFVFAHQKGFLGRMLSVRPLVHLGEVSFSIYMIHAVVLDWANRFMNHTFYGYSPHTWQIMAQLGLIAIIIAFSDVMYRYVETPFRELAKRAVNRRAIEQCTV